MKAIFKTGGKQYIVNENDEVYVEKLNLKPKDKVVFNEVLYVDGKIGNPFVEGAKVTAEVVKQGKRKKIKIFHYRPKKSSKRAQGHRQPYTKLIIKKIEG